MYYRYEAQYLKGQAIDLEVKHSASFLYKGR